MFELKIGDKKILLRFGMHLGEALVRESATITSSTKSFLAALIYYAHENYCLGLDLPTQIKKGEIFVWLEDNHDNEEVSLELTRLMTAYNESKPAQVINSAGEKKKEPATESLENTPLGL